MFESMSVVDRALWRIAELGARCGQQSRDVDRRPMWEELERIIAEVGAEVRSAREEAEAARTRLERLEGRLRVARQERDRERSLVREHRADADAARRERDAAAEKVMKAGRDAQAARAAVRESEVRLEQVEADRDGIVAAMEALRARVGDVEAALAQAAAERDAVAAERDAVAAEREGVAAERDALVVQRDAAVAERDAAVAQRDAAVAERDAVVAERDASTADFEGALSSLAARAEGATIPIPEVVAADRPDDEPPSVAVRWRPAWSEWATGPTEPDPVELAETEAVADEPDTTDDGVDDDGPAPDAAGFCYLNVAATIAHLLPDDLTPLLVPGARVLRREGRLFATLEVDAALLGPNAGAEDLLRNLSEAGLKLEWTTGAAVGVEDVSPSPNGAGAAARRPRGRARRVSTPHRG